MLDQSDKWWMDVFLGSGDFSINVRGVVLALFAQRDGLDEVDVDQVVADLGMSVCEVREALRVMGERREDCEG